MKTAADALRRDLDRLAPGLAAADALFDSLDDVIYCVKDHQRRYVSVNQAFVARVRLPSKAALLGRTARELFPVPLAAGYEQQDDTVFRTGRELRDRLERITHAAGDSGWFLAHKVPVRDAAGQVVALAGISRDLRAPVATSPGYAAVARAIETMQTAYAQPLRIEDLARASGLTPAQFERRMRSIVHVPPRQFLTRLRVEAAAAALQDGTAALSDIALACGFYDQASFSRQFRQATGLSPRQYREATRGGAAAITPPGCPPP